VTTPRLSLWPTTQAPALASIVLVPAPGISRLWIQTPSQKMADAVAERTNGRRWLFRKLKLTLATPPARRSAIGTKQKPQQPRAMSRELEAASVSFREPRRQGGNIRWYYPSMFLTGILFHRVPPSSPHTTKPRPGGCHGPPRFWLVLSF
jgi:hypothetical protein